ncbi:MAG: undecaprenyl/decaprenyl-phosphate alpha-N-acetylglucosaminyl 1-phosphate transferase [Thiobacillaceae bacterium]|nr:undecaprenyl/decaprenyl-phosphate alpha-N-acetylglucosaminyl 1-phosphate transferase [Thiobacillaceae bacterium]
MGLFGLSILAAGLALRYGIALSSRYGLVDRPSGHKAHTHNTPFIGGVGVLVALACTLPIIGIEGYGSATQLVTLGVCALVLFLTGFADDLRQLGFKPRLLIQSGVVLLMAWVGGVHLQDLGALLGPDELKLGWLAIPFTVFAAVGVINALNMIDGIDGLSGTLSAITLAFIALVAHTAGDHMILGLAVALLGGVTAFLYFNLRHSGRRRARTFLGDNGSMLLGLLLAWLLIDLTQGEQRAIAPIVAVWLFAVPLMDTVGIMVRRVWLGKSPFSPDRYHIHHLFLQAGFRVEETVYAIAAIHLLFGLIGLLLYHYNVPQSFMLTLFLTLFMGYVYFVVRPWRLVPKLRRLHGWLRLPSRYASGVFIGYFAAHEAEGVLAPVIKQLEGKVPFIVHVFHCKGCKAETSTYALIQFEEPDLELKAAQAHIWQRRIRTLLAQSGQLQVRQYIERQTNALTGSAISLLGRRWQDRRAVKVHHLLWSHPNGYGARALAA